MKKRLLLNLPLLMAFFYLASCSNDTKYVTIEPEPQPLKEVPHKELLGHHKVISCVSTVIDGRPVAIPERVGEIWLFEEDKLTIGETDAIDYTYDDNVITTAGRIYTADKEGGKLVIFYSEGGKTITLLFDGFELEESSLNVSPAVDEQNAYVDTYLDITFDDAPVLGTSGSIAIYKKDGTKVDEIKMEDKPLPSKGLYNSTMVDIIGLPTAANGSRLRAVNYNPVTIEGNKVRIKPHYGVLEYDTEYYVTIDGSAIISENFAGIEANEWTFKTKAEEPSLSANRITVGKDGDTDFRTVQAALDHAGKIGKDTAVTVYIKNGIYEELLYLRSKNNLTIEGESRDGVIIRYDNCDNLNPGTGATAVRPEFGIDNITDGGRALFLVESASNLRFENLTIENIHVKTGDRDQAEVVYFNSTSGTLVFVNCNLLSKQDTLNIKGYCWFYNTLVAGDVDFIWGSPVVALFEECELKSITGEGYILQARVPESNKDDKGFVFLNCSLTKADGVASGTTSLARSSYNSSYYDNVAFVNCKMDSHISAVGWKVDAGKSPNPSVASINAGWKEYGSTDLNGNVLDISGRLENVQYQLSNNEYEAGYKNRTQIMNAYTIYTGKDLSWMKIR